MIKSKNHMSGSEWWLSSENLSFSSIVRQSKIPDHWARYDSEHLRSVKSVLKPVNKYVLSLYPRPEILDIKNNLVTFRQRTHAEIWIEDKGNNILYAVDKCHQRQFYPSKNNIEIAGCFLATYRFYIPWFINKNVEIKIDTVKNEKTPFHINKKIFLSNFVDMSTPYVDTEFINFKIKNVGEYSLKENYGIISKNTAMYDMSVILTDKEIGTLREDYGQ
jgi:hypothetical protein